MAARKPARGGRQDRFTRGTSHYEMLGSGLKLGDVKSGMDRGSKEIAPVVVRSFVVPEWVLKKVCLRIYIYTSSLLSTHLFLIRKLLLERRTRLLQKVRHCSVKFLKPKKVQTCFLLLCSPESKESSILRFSNFRKHTLVSYK